MSNSVREMRQTRRGWGMWSSVTITSAILVGKSKFVGTDPPILVTETVNIVYQDPVTEAGPSQQLQERARPLNDVEKRSASRKSTLMGSTTSM